LHELVTELRVVPDQGPSATPLNASLHPDDFGGESFVLWPLCVDLEIDSVCVIEPGKKLIVSLADQGTGLRKIHADQRYEKEEEDSNTAAYHPKFRYPPDCPSAPLFAGASASVSHLFAVFLRHCIS
jgi:hypothetical protein